MKSTLTVVAAVLAVLLLFAWMAKRDAEALQAAARDPAIDIALAVGAALGGLTPIEWQWCPKRMHGRKNSHGQWRESDAGDAVLICFYESPR